MTIRPSGGGSFCHLCGAELDQVADDGQGNYCYECPSCDTPTHWFWEGESTTLKLHIIGETCTGCQQVVGAERR